MSRERGGSQDGKSKTTVFTRGGSTVTQAVRTPILTIPSETEGSADFKQRLAALFAAQSTHIYIDTSFLMWMSVVAWIGAEMEFARSQAVASGDAFEHRPPECGLGVWKDTDDPGTPANLTV